MSDEHEHRRDPARGASEPDETRQFSPFADETQQGEPIHPHDDTRSDDPAAAAGPEPAAAGASSGEQPADGHATRIAPPGDADATRIAPPADADATQIVRPGDVDATEIAPPGDADATQIVRPDDADATRIAGPGEGDATQVVPPVAAAPPPPRDATAVMPAQDWDAAPDSVWAGRAEVRPPRPLGPDDTAADWSAVPPDEPRGRWWMPIVVGIVGLILVGLIAYGIYLIAQNTGDGPATPPATPSAPQVATAPATTEPTTTPPTTTPATTEPTGPAEVTVPALIGLSREEAQQALERRGLSFREILRPDDAAPGTVIDSDPSEGQEVPPGTRVTLVVATAPTTTPATTAPTTTPTEEADED